MKLHLVAFQNDLFQSWQKYFHQTPEVEIHQGDILSFSGDAIVSPANGFGFMDGGLDLKYSEHFGWDLEARLRERIERVHFGELPVGRAEIVPIADAQFGYLVSAPTMRVPMDVSQTANAYLAFKAALVAIASFNRENDSPIGSLFCPGLATGEGKMPSDLCARQMSHAYRECLTGNFRISGGLAGAVRQHMYLTGYEI